MSRWLKANKRKAMDVGYDVNKVMMDKLSKDNERPAYVYEMKEKRPTLQQSLEESMAKFKEQKVSNEDWKPANIDDNSSAKYDKIKAQILNDQGVITLQELQDVLNNIRSLSDILKSKNVK